MIEWVNTNYKEMISIMPNIQQTKRARRNAARQMQEKTTKITVISALVLVVVFVIWSLVFNQKAPPATASKPTNSSVQNTPELIGTKQYSSAPPMMIDTGKQYLATVKMAKGGEFVIQLFPDKAPITVNSFVFLAQHEYFDGVTFHRVLSGFMAQGGDPTGTGSGGPGYKFVNEDSDMTFDKAGVVAMANGGRDTNGSQFFITFAPQLRLNGDYTIFGQVISGMDVVNSITLRDPEKNPSFSGDVIESITITEK
jgi:peptidylprolyl isomerase